MNFEQIETKRLLLTVMTPEDMNFIFMNCPIHEIKKILGHRTDDDFQKEAFKQKMGYSSYDRKFKLFLMQEKQTNIHIGRCGLHNWNADHCRAEVGYAMSDDQYKRQGYMSEAVHEILQYGFDQMKLHRIEALVSVSNLASIRILKNNEFVNEGLLRQHYKNGNNFEDSMMFAKLLSNTTQS